MTNLGVAPPDTDTNVGLFRVLYGDTEYADLDPAVAGYGDYTELSDSEIETFLSQGGDSVSRGIGYYCLSLAGQSALRSRVVKDYDLQVDLTKRAADLRAIAQEWFDLADREDSASGVSDFFESYEFGGTDDYDHPVIEAAPYPLPVI